jgi:hypothetical protein
LCAGRLRFGGLRAGGLSVILTVNHDACGEMRFARRGVDHDVLAPMHCMEVRCMRVLPADDLIPRMTIDVKLPLGVVTGLC